MTTSARRWIRSTSRYPSFLGCKSLNWAFPSAEVLPPRTRADPRGYARTPPGSAGLPPTQFSGGRRRMSGERSADSAGLRPNPRGSARTPPRTGGVVRSENVRQKKISKDFCPPRKTFRYGRPSAADTPRTVSPRTLPPRTIPPRTLPPRKVVAFTKSIAIKLSRDFIFSSFPARVAGCLTA